MQRLGHGQRNPPEHDLLSWRDGATMLDIGRYSTFPGPQHTSFYRQILGQRARPSKLAGVRTRGVVAENIHLFSVVSQFHDLQLSASPHPYGGGGKKKLRT